MSFLIKYNQVSLYLINSRAARVRARTRSPIAKKIWLTIHPRNFGCDVSLRRPSVHSLGGGGREGNQVLACLARSIFSWRETEIVRCICTTRVFLGRKSRKKLRGHCRCVQKLVYFRNLFLSISWHKDFVTLVLSF